MRSNDIIRSRSRRRRLLRVVLAGAILALLVDAMHPATAMPAHDPAAQQPAAVSNAVTTDQTDDGGTDLQRTSAGPTLHVTPELAALLLILAAGALLGGVRRLARDAVWFRPLGRYGPEM